MSDAHDKHRNRYDVSGNPEAEFFDAARRVMVNKRAIQSESELQLAEEVALARAYELCLSQVRTDTPLTCALIQHVHRSIFGELYDWAGQWRTVWISKPGMTWPAPDFLEQHVAEFESAAAGKFPAANLDDAAFCQAIAWMQGEFLVIHPFREGNARTIKLVSDLFAAQTNRPPLLYDQTEAGQDAYIEAAFRRNYAPLAEIILQALQLAK